MMSGESMSESSFEYLMQKQLSRRSVLQFSLGAMLVSAMPLASATTMLRQHSSLIGFESIPTADLLDDVVVPEGYRAEVFFRWGDPVSDGPAFNMDASNSAADQALQAGMHHDAIEFYSLPAGTVNSEHGLLVMNHEYLDTQIIHPDGGFLDSPHTFNAEKVRKEQNAHGVSIIEVERNAAGWQIKRPSVYARRITANTPMRIAGPAAGHPMMQTIADPLGVEILGTLNNCANGKTPWGTYLTCEENFNGYFSLADETLVSAEQKQRWKRYGLGYSYYGWQQFDSRFDMQLEPNEANRFGWVVEIDPFDPQSQPVKRTAFGRYCRECSVLSLGDDGRMAFYSGDDTRGEYIYKFVPNGRYVPGANQHNRQLLDEGTLYVARFDADGSGRWLALLHGQNGLTAENGFPSQAEVLINARAAADRLGATPMDRPEWLAVHPRSREVYVTLTNNDQRGDKVPLDKVNPRPNNLHGHILRWNEEGGDPTATRFEWEVFLLAGESEGARDAHGKSVPAHLTGTIKGDRFSSPDGLAFDGEGRLWIQTDFGDS